MAQLPDELLEALMADMDEKVGPWAKAKALTKSLEELRKMTKAALMQMARALREATSRDGAEAWAYTHEQYKLVSDRLIAAIEGEVLAQHAYEQAVRRWESWRTLCANDRHLGTGR